MSVFDYKITKPQNEQRIFLDDSVTLARYDKLKYPIFDKLTQQQLGFFWRPEEVDVSKERNQYKDLPPHQRGIVDDILGRATMLDSLQGRGPTAVLNRIVSLPEVETWNTVWAFSEQIHSRSYTHIIRSVYSDPSELFDGIMLNDEIVNCAKDTTKYYDDLEHWIRVWEGADFRGRNSIELEIKRAIWLCINSINALEGIRFYAAFACIWALAETKTMEGFAKILKLICRDENLHLASTQHYLKLLPKDDPDFADIKIECEPETTSIFVNTVEQEKGWARHVFRNGSMIGLNEDLLVNYIEWLGNKRMTALGLKSPYKGGSNPLPWTEKWIAGSDVQVAPQETEIPNYIVGGIKQDLTKDTFKDIQL